MGVEWTIVHDVWEPLIKIMVLCILNNKWVSYQSSTLCIQYHHTVKLQVSVYFRSIVSSDSLDIGTV